jgi:hypothetical protein
MTGDRSASLLLQGFTPMLVAPPAGVGRIDADDRDAVSGGHGGEAIAELRSGDARHRTTKPFPTPAAAHGFAAGSAGTDEV